MYGLNKTDKDFALKKIKNQKDFLKNSFLLKDNNKLYLSDFVKNSFHNTDKYIAEVNHRVWSLYNYADQQNLVNVFMTITLPSEYHPKKYVKYANGKKYLKNNPKYDPENTPKKGVLELSRIWQNIRQLRAYRDIPKDQKCYFRVTEPTKSGTPHLHISAFIPSDKVDSFKKSVSSRYPEPQVEIKVNINNPVGYLMKYILKTFDDLRENPDNLSDLTLWYILHGICRFYTSRTLISLDIYRPLRGRYTLLQLTKMYKNNELTVLLNIKTGVPEVIYESTEYGDIRIYQKFNFSPEYISNDKVRATLKSEQDQEQEQKYYDVDVFNADGTKDKLRFLKTTNTFFKPLEVKYPYSKMSDFNLLTKYYDAIDNESISNNEFKIINMEIAKRELLENDPLNWKPEHIEGLKS